MVLWRFWQSPGTKDVEYAYFMEQAQKKSIREANIYLDEHGADVVGQVDDSEYLKARVSRESLPEVTKALKESGLTVSVKESTNPKELLTFFAPIVLIVVAWATVMIRRHRAESQGKT